MAKQVASTCNFSLPKCKKECKSSNDLISEMPDEILHSILSRLTLKEAARTSKLSQRWKNLWKFISVLNFDASGSLEYMRNNRDGDIYEDERMKYGKWVNKVLGSHYWASSVTLVDVEEFRICFDLPGRFEKIIYSWIEFASVKRVQRFELDISPPHGGLRLVDIYKPSPPFIFANFGSLITSLILKNVAVADEHLEHFLSNSPFLESLCVHYSSNLLNLRIVGPSLKLKNLEVKKCSQLVLIEIFSAINLVSFEYEGGKISLLVKNLPQLVEMSLSGPLLKLSMSTKET